MSNIKLVYDAFGRPHPVKEEEMFEYGLDVNGLPVGGGGSSSFRLRKFTITSGDYYMGNTTLFTIGENEAVTQAQVDAFNSTYRPNLSINGNYFESGMAFTGDVTISLGHPQSPSLWMPGTSYFPYDGKPARIFLDIDGESAPVLTTVNSSPSGTFSVDIQGHSLGPLTTISYIHTPGANFTSGIYEVMSNNQSLLLDITAVDGGITSVDILHSGPSFIDGAGCFIGIPSPSENPDDDAIVVMSRNYGDPVVSNTQEMREHLLSGIAAAISVGHYEFSVSDGAILWTFSGGYEDLTAEVNAYIVVATPEIG